MEAEGGRAHPAAPPSGLQRGAESQQLVPLPMPPRPLLSGAEPHTGHPGRDRGGWEQGSNWLLCSVCCLEP